MFDGEYQFDLLGLCRGEFHLPGDDARIGIHLPVTVLFDLDGDVLIHGDWDLVLEEEVHLRRFGIAYHKFICECAFAVGTEAAHLTEVFELVAFDYDLLVTAEREVEGVLGIGRIDV